MIKIPSDPEVWKRECGRRIRQARIALTYEELKAFTDATGLPYSSTGQQENGKLEPQLKVMVALRNFGVTSDWVLFGILAGMDPTLQRAILDAKHNPAMRYKSEQK